MTIVQLQVFLAIVDRASFTRAADDLFMSQSAVSHAVASLEREVGGPLFERGPGRPVALSDLGARIEPHARELVRRAGRIGEEASSYLGLETGKLRIASVASVASRVLPPIIATFRARHPRVEVVILEGADYEVHDWLVEGAADVGFLSVPIDDLDVLGTITEDEFRAILPASHPLASRSALRPADLASERFVMSRAGCEPLILGWFAGQPPTVEYEVRALDTLVGFVREGLGITLMPELVLPDDTSGLAIVAIEPPARRQVVMAKVAGSELAPAATAFVRDVVPVPVAADAVA